MNKQQIMAKYTKLVAKKLYGITDFVVRFDDLGARGVNLTDKRFYCQNDKKIEEIFPKNMSSKDIQKWKDLNNYIGYDEKIYTQKELDYDTWLTIVHEVTHFEVHASYDFEKKVVYHNEQFKQKEEENLQKVKDLREQFNKEIAWEDIEYAKDYDDRSEQYQEEQDELNEGVE